MSNPSNQGAGDPCPKCGVRRQGSSTACARCGLVFALWKPEIARDRGLDAELDALWQRVLLRWDDPTAHDAFLKRCSMSGLLGPAGRGYRARLDERPDDAVARAMQERVVTMATAAFNVTARQNASPPVTRKNWFWAVVLAAMGAGVLFALFRRR